jgi:peroxiredoxin
MGIEMRQNDGGVVVVSVFPGSPAASAGLDAGDELLTIGGEAIARPTDVHVALAPRRVGDQVLVTFRREGKERFSRLHLGPKPDSVGLMRDLYVGQRAPSISSLRTIQGAVVPSLEQLKGKVVVLEFWATWCSACRLLSPTLERWHERHAASGLRVLSVSAEPSQQITHALTQLDVDHPVFSDEDETVTRAYRAAALPTVFLIDQEGIVRNVMVGFDPKQLVEFDAQLRQLMGGQPTTPRAPAAPAAGAPPASQ